MKLFHCLLVYLLFFLLQANSLLAQDSSNKIKHAIQVQAGAGGAKYFSGIAAGINYEAHHKSYFAKASVNGLEEFVLFGGDPQTVIDFSLTLNKKVPVGLFIFSFGAGLSYVKHKLELRNLYPDYYPNEYRFKEKGSIGYPAELQIMTSKKGLRAGLGGHANFNSLNKFFIGYLLIGYEFK